MATNGVNGHSNGINGSSKSALCSADELVSQKYDYVIVGGGTAGLCVAARLTEDPKVTVAVLEAGENRMDDKSVSTPCAYLPEKYWAGLGISVQIMAALYPTMIGRKEYDWCMTSVKQPTAGNKEYSMPRGKLLGGSSGINYLMYVRGSKGDYDGWESLGNKGWGWKGLAPYFKKHQTLDKTKSKSSNPQFTPAAGGDEFHGSSGPIHTSFNDWYSPFEEDFVEAAYEVSGGERTLHDAWSGDHMGFYSSLGAVNRTDDPGARSYAATGYLKPNMHRPNLKVLVEAHATKILGIENKQATGVEFVHNGKKYTVSATKEVVLSTGVIQTPQLLELSGIGDPQVLSAAGVECKVENTNVGANFQDHVLGGLLFDLKPGIKSLDDLHGEDFAKASQELYDKTHEGPFGSPGMMMGFVSYASLVGKDELEKTIKEIKEKSHAKTKFEKAQEKVIVDQLRDPTFANLQTFCIMCRLDVAEGSDQTKFFSKPPEGVTQVSLLMCLEHPLSRGSVHIKSSDPLAAPEIDPGYFRHPTDVRILAQGMKWMDEVSKHPLLAKQLARRELPPEDYDLGTEEGRMEYVRNHVSTQYHLIGTAAMGEVVDDRLLVKGVKGLRVIDASVFPGHVSGNIMSSTYAVAEKGADLIKEDWGIDVGRTM